MISHLIKYADIIYCYLLHRIHAFLYLSLQLKNFIHQTFHGFLFSIFDNDLLEYGEEFYIKIKKHLNCKAQIFENYLYQMTANL